jgi:ribosomal protein S19
MRSSLPTQRRRGTQTPFVGRLVFNLLCLALRFRSLSSPALLFQRRTQSQAYNVGWIPRVWKVRRGWLLRWFRSHTLRVHRGRRWRRLLVQRWVVGFTAGSFARTAALAAFKRRASEKKQRRLLGKTGPQLD